MEQAVAAFADEICARTLAQTLLAEPGGEWTAARAVRVEGIPVRVAIRKRACTRSSVSWTTYGSPDEAPF